MQHYKRVLSDTVSATTAAAAAAAGMQSFNSLGGAVLTLNCNIFLVVHVRVCGGHCLLCLCVFQEDIVYCVLCIFQEDILKKLQNSVDSEEKRWAQKLKHSDDELNKVCCIAPTRTIDYHSPHFGVTV